MSRRFWWTWAIASLLAYAALIGMVAFKQHTVALPAVSYGTVTRDYGCLAAPGCVCRLAGGVPVHTCDALAFPSTWKGDK